jgi:hypothetical protein
MVRRRAVSRSAGGRRPGSRGCRVVTRRVYPGGWIVGDIRKEIPSLTPGCVRLDGICRRKTDRCGVVLVARPEELEPSGVLVSFLPQAEKLRLVESHPECFLQFFNAG